MKVDEREDFEEALDGRHVARMDGRVKLFVDDVLQTRLRLV